MTENGFIRALLAGRGRSLTEAFGRLRASPHASRACEFPDRALFGARIELKPKDGQGFIDFLEMRHSIYVLTENAVFTEPRHEWLPGDGLVSFHIRLSGELNLLIDRSVPLRVTGPSLLVWHQPDHVDASECFAPAVRHQAVTIFCRPEFLESGLLADESARAAFRERLLPSQGKSVDFCQLPVTSEILAAARDIANAPYEGRLRLIYLEAKALELYCLILAALDRLWEAVEEQFDAPDLQRLQRAREILGARFHPVPTIAALARELAINPSKLKRGFKWVFGRTVFEYGLDCRMHHALRLLRDRHMQIGRVAEAVGYTHQTAFAAAFKRYFGFRPKEVRRAPAPVRNRRSKP